jgi:hypothetical protein
MRQQNLQSFHQSLYGLRGNDLYASRPPSIAVIAKEHNRLFRTVDLYPITERCYIFPLDLWANNQCGATAASPAQAYLDYVLGRKDAVPAIFEDRSAKISMMAV